MTKLKGTPVPDDFQLTETTLVWLGKRYPNVDAEIAVERFLSWACNYSYQNHQRTFQNFLMREADNNKLGPMLKKPKTKEETLRDEGRRCGFREPISGETYSQYEQALRAHQQLRSNVVVSMLKK